MWSGLHAFTQVEPEKLKTLTEGGGDHTSAEEPSIAPAWSQGHDTFVSLKLTCQDPGAQCQVSRLTGGTSLVVQCLSIHLSVQGTRVQSLVWEDPTCCWATKPECYSYNMLHNNKTEAIAMRSPPTQGNQIVAPCCSNQTKPECSKGNPAQPKIK